MRTTTVSDLAMEGATMVAHNLPDGALQDMTPDEMVTWVEVYALLKRHPLQRSAMIFNANQVILDIRGGYKYTNTFARSDLS